MRRTPVYITIALLLSVAALALSFSSTKVQPVASAAGNQDYVLTATVWDAAQTQAVQNAGGTVKFSNKRSGIAVVSSENPNFLKQVMASGVIGTGAADQMVQWQMPSHEVALEETSVTPGDETFVNLQWNIKAIEAAGAWAAGYDGTGVRVAVIDGGIWNTHADLE